MRRLKDSSRPGQQSAPPHDPARPRISAAEARDGLLAFCQRTMASYQVSDHHRRIAEALEAVERGAISRLIITMPPRHGKSELASIRFPAWFLGRNPDKRIIGTSYAAALAYRLSRHARNIVGGPGWPFADVRLAEDAKQISGWDIGGHRGGYIAAGVGGPIVGQGAHCLLIDDPIKNQDEANSAEYRDGLWDWYQGVAYTRLEGRGAVIVIQTRWHHDDLAGRLIAAQKTGGDQWEVLHLPALTDTPTGPVALWPDKYDVDDLLRIRGTVGARVFAAQYQGTPSDEDTTLFPRKWWKYYAALPQAFDQVIQSWDMAFKDTKGSDYVVGQVWGAKGADRYLLDQVRGRKSFTDTLAAVRALSARWPQAELKLVEDKANGPAVIDTLSSELQGLVAINPEGGKLARASAVGPQVEAGNVWLPSPDDAPWVDEFVQECANFPAGAHDDQVDAMSQALLRLRQAALPFGWFDDEPEREIAFAALELPEVRRIDEDQIATAFRVPAAAVARYVPETGEDDWRQRDDDLPWWAAP